MVPEIYGLVLCGGESKRMGKDKSMLTYHEKPQWEHMIELLSQVCSKVYISQKRKSTHIPESLLIVDQYDIKSPINGILSAFDSYPDKAWLIVPCDMPLIDLSHINQLIKERDRKSFATCFLDSDGQLPHPMFCIWEPKCHKKLKEFSKNDISPRAFLRSNNTKLVKSKKSDFLRNVNSTTDYEQLISEISKNK